MIKTAPLPPPIQQKLKQVRRRKTKVDLQTAMLCGLVVFLLFMLGAMAIDWAFVLFSTAVRSLLTLSTFVAATLAAIFCARRVLLYRSNWDQVAASIDKETPVLEERWTTVANLASPNGSGRGVNQRILDQVTKEATALESHVVPNEVVSKKALVIGRIAIVCLLVVIAVACFLDGQRLFVLMARFFAPTSNISLTRIATGETDIVAARDEPFTIRADMAGRSADEATLSLKTETEASQSLTVFPTVSEQSLNHKIKSVKEPFSYRWRAGDGQTTWQHVDVADRPEIAAISLRVTPPAYTGRKVAEWDKLPRKVGIPNGSQVVVDVWPTPNAKIESASISDAVGLPKTLESEQGVQLRWTFEATNDFELSPVLTEQHGLTNRRPPVCRVRVQQDVAPTVSIITPSDETVASADDEIEIKYSAEDDHGIVKAELLVYREDQIDADAQPAAVIPVPLPQSGNREIRGSAFLDLDELDLKEGESISYSIRVYDSREVLSPDEPSEQLPTRWSDTAENNEVRMDDPDPSSELTPVPANWSDTAEQNENPADDTDPFSNLANVPANNSPESTQSPLNNNPPREADGDSTSTASDSTSNQNSATNPESKPDDERMAADPPKQTNPNLANNSEQTSDSPQNGQAPPPTPPMTMRSLDIAQSMESSPMRIKVDSTVNRYESEQRKKLEVAIAPVLSRLDQLLESAASQSDRVIQDLTRGDEPVREHDLALSTASKDVTTASAVVDKLLDKTQGTPYAFVGLQVEDIRNSHMTPANESLSSALSETSGKRLPPSRAAWQNISRAQERLGELSARFERVRRELRLADNVSRIKKMYNIAVEDSLALLRMSQEQINRYERNPVEFELDEEYLTRLEEVLKMRRDLRAELAKILAEDPRLMRRFSESLRGQTDTLRDQMTLLVERQKDLSDEFERYVSAKKEEHPKIAAAIWAKRLIEATDISIAASKLQDLFETWIPLDMDTKNPTLENARSLTHEVAANARQIAKKSSLLAFDTDDRLRIEKPNKKAIEALVVQGNRMADQLQDLDVALRTIQLEGSPGLSTHVVNRLTDLRRVAAKQSSWLRRIQELNAGRYSGVAASEQYELANDTSDLTDKLRNLETQLTGLLQRQTLPADLAKHSQELIQCLDDEVSPAQLSTTFSLRKKKLPIAKQQAAEAARAMVKAEGKLDDVFTRAIEELDKLPVQDPIASLLNDPTLDEILAQLENELNPLETLGIPGRPDNLRTVSDWMGGGSSTRNGVQGMANLLRSRHQEQRRKLAEAYRKAMSRAEKDKASVRTPTGEIIASKEVRWNTLVSKLNDELLQGDGAEPPEQYRQAIEQYFDRISRLQEEDLAGGQ